MQAAEPLMFVPCCCACLSSEHSSQGLFIDYIDFRSLILLVVSITDWCEHGALLTSAVVMAYTIWLICESLAVSRPASIHSESCFTVRRPHTTLQLPIWVPIE